MHVIRATEMGLCFGVRDALEAAWLVAEPARTTIHGELVHNEVVQTRLRARGFSFHAEHDRSADAPTPAVLITAHGVSDRERGTLAAAGKELIDTTCPLVVRAHDAARELEREGRHVVVIGRPGHVEVRGLTGDLTSFTVVRSPSQVVAFGHARLGVIAQTTTPERLVREVVAAIRRQNPAADVRVVDTVCEPTKARMRAARELAQRCEVVVVVGGKNSNNTAQLVLACRELGAETFHVQGADDLRERWFRSGERVGLTAGTSTLDSTIDTVERRLRQIAERLGARLTGTASGRSGPAGHGSSRT